MTDRERIIERLEECLSASCRGFRTCPYSEDEWDAVKTALALLKEQEAVKPTALVDKDTGCTRYVCSNCGNEMWWYEQFMNGRIVQIKHSYCPSCGRKVKWDD